MQMGDGVHKYHAWRWSRQKIADEPYNLIVLPTASGGYGDPHQDQGLRQDAAQGRHSRHPQRRRGARKLFGGRKLFDYPKSVDLLRTLIGSVPGKDFVCLDLFSGSATTAHAVMRLNTEDGGRRGFIMVQLPEPCGEKSEAAQAGFQTICEIGKARIRRAGDQIRTEFPGACPDIGFRVFRVDEGAGRRSSIPGGDIPAADRADGVQYPGGPHRPGSALCLPAGPGPGHPPAPHQPGGRRSHRPPGGRRRPGGLF